MISISEMEPQQQDLPEAKRVRVGRLEGDAKPYRDHTGDLRWHVALITHDGDLKHLVQGFGPTVEEAVQDALTHLRRYVKSVTELLAHMEAALLEK